MIHDLDPEQVLPDFGETHLSIQRLLIKSFILKYLSKAPSHAPDTTLWIQWYTETYSSLFSRVLVGDPDIEEIIT